MSKRTFNWSYFAREVIGDDKVRVIVSVREHVEKTLVTVGYHVHLKVDGEFQFVAEMNQYPVGRWMCPAESQTWRTRTMMTRGVPGVSFIVCDPKMVISMIGNDKIVADMCAAVERMQAKAIEWCHARRSLKSMLAPMQEVEITA